jgi:hypothetical protein
MASFPAGTTPFFLQFEHARGSFVQEIPRALDDAADQQHARSLPFRYSMRACDHLTSAKMGCFQ